jgi:peptide/nickel transport system permease protein/oligopeptide transport system permease protein
MLQFLVKRLIGLVFVLLGVTFITFIIGYAAPGDPIRVMMGQHFDLHTWLRLRHAYGLDLPWYEQYYNFLVHLFRLNFGLSYHYPNRSVNSILLEGVPISIELAFWGLIITILIGIPAGVLSAVKANSWIDTTNMAIALIFYAVPVFALCVFAQAFIGWFNTSFDTEWPVSNWGIPWQYSWSDIQFKLAPILVYGAAGYAYFARIARTNMLEVLRQDYIRTARAKGLRERVIIYRHALRNAMIPIITYIGYLIGLLVAGAFFVEHIFNIPGIAQTTVQASFDRDYPVIQATVVLIATGTVLGNMIADILYTVFDPRIKLS